MGACSGNGCSAVIRDTDELTIYLEKFYKEEAISQYLEKYNSGFFETNVLLIDSINQPFGLEAGYEIVGVELIEDKIDVSLKNTKIGGEDVLTLCLAQISVPKGYV
ncbi:hypothetical protein [Ruminococcus flavefaciens]|uniref:hypothetical protein n=1 Tax=Ruminococcus flavefaciens TaxID=1265 RepID=UPI0026EBC1E8|nr:hypothetical protein [Ruminococcus flavefaciens]MDD7516158.1 hypothetical protein [Ruminococcus flavefaciens]MDY5692419.1 hypothetical protein [Ruminococcus flavefaciens]